MDVLIGPLTAGKHSSGYPRLFFFFFPPPMPDSDALALRRLRATVMTGTVFVFFPPLKSLYDSVMEIVEGA